MVSTFPFKPNWANSVELTLSYKTDIFTSRSGKEQRRALRSTPRRSISYSSLIHGDQRRDFTRMVATQQNADFLIPDWTVGALATYGVSAGAVSFSLRELVPAWLVTGSVVFLMEGDRIAQATVAEASGYTVTMAAPNGDAFSPLAVLRRAATGLLGPLSVVSNTSTVLTAAIDFDVAPTTYAGSTNGFFAHVTGGKEVFAFPWNWDEAVTTDNQWPIEQVDFGRGVVVNYRIVDFGTATQKVTLVAQNDRVDYLLRFIERQKGQRGEFWMPTGTDDLTLLSNIANGATTLTTSGDDASVMFGDVYCGVALYLRDGRKVYRRVTNAITTTGNSVLTVAEAFSGAITVADVLRISWMRPARFASDEATIEYLTNSVVQWQATTTTVTFGDDTQNYATLDGAGMWAMDNWAEESQSIMDRLAYLMNIVPLYGDVASMGHGAMDDLVNSELWEIAQ